MIFRNTPSHFNAAFHQDKLRRRKGQRNFTHAFLFFLLNILSYIASHKCLLLLTITGQVVGTHIQPLRAPTVKRSGDVSAMMTATSIVVGAFVNV